MNTSALITAVLLALGATAALAQTSATASASASASAPAASAAQAKPAPAKDAEPDPDRQVCKNERPVGSLIPARICKTAAQWKMESDNSRKMIQDMQQRTGPAPR